jgi:pimeloyl-ACP methyl ester carboxylesterase
MSTVLFSTPPSIASMTLFLTLLRHARSTLPALLLPGCLLIWWLKTDTCAPYYALIAFGLLQVIHIVVIEWCRRDRDLTPSHTLEFGERTAPKCAVLVHGFADTPEAWRREAEYLAQKGWRVIAPEIDLTATAREWIATVYSALLEARTYAGHVELWGHSMGGALALVLAQTTQVDRLVLWAPFLEPYMGKVASTTLYILHRLLLIWPFTLTWFPVNRHGKGTPETFYRVRRVIPTRTFTAALAMPKIALSSPPMVTPIILLSQRDTVVRNTPVQRAFPNAHYLLAANPRSSHALTNAVDWQENLTAILEQPYEVSHSL